VTKERETITATHDERDGQLAPPSPCLYRVVDCTRPTAPSARIPLEGVQELTIGRGGGPGGPGRVEVDDPRMSSTHATLVRRLQTWVLRDAGSKNGSLVNGVKQDSAVLHDGDVIELGRTFFLFRDEVPDAPAGMDAEPIPGLPTLMPELHAALAALARTAASTVPVVLRGESGVGKELAARALHAASGRGGALVAVNCGALPDALVESELFGYRRGAFSGASEDRPGLVRAADGGTLFLDEVGDLREASQAALLRVLQEHEVTPLGATRPVPVDVRIVAATHRDLEAQVAAGRFRRDLHARLAGFQLELPPLRERREDLGLIVAAILRRVAPDRADAISLHPALARAWFGYPFPGNVRELERCLAAAVVLAGDDAVGLEHTPTWFRDALTSPPPLVLEEEDQRRRDEIVALLREHRGNIAAVARSMGKARMQVQRWIKRYGIPRNPE
jgi:DNA-binding NtrC family response regulator